MSIKPWYTARKNYRQPAVASSAANTKRRPRTVLAYCPSWIDAGDVSIPAFHEARETVSGRGIEGESSVNHAARLPPRGRGGG